MDNKQCKDCKWGNCLYFTPNDYFCAKYNMKPRQVYYEGQECENFEPKVELDRTEKNKKIEDLGFKQ